MKSKRMAAALQIVALVFGMAGCGSSGEAANKDDVFVLGIASGQSGYLAGFDNAILAGIKDEAKRLNAGGGLGGRYRLKLEIKDTRSDIAVQATATQALVDGGADALVLACDSDPSIAGGQVAERAELPAFGCPSNPSKVGEFLFQMYVPERLTPAVLAQYAAKQGWKRGFTVGSPDTAYTQTGVEYFTKAFEGAGGTIVKTASYGLDQQDFSTLVQTIKAANPDFVHVMMYEPVILAFLKQLRGAGVQVPVIGDQLETPGIVALSKSQRGAVSYTALADSNPGTAVGKYLSEIARDYGSDNAVLATIYGHDLVAALDGAVRVAGSKNGAEVAKALSGLTFEGIAGKVSYNWPGSDNTQMRQILVKAFDNSGGTVVKWKTEPDPASLPAQIDN